MYKIPHFPKSKLKVNKCTEGETLESKIERIVNNKEPIRDGAPIIYTPRKDGVLPSTNIRTDRFEVAIDAVNNVVGSYQARRENSAKPKEESKKDGGTESIQGKGETTPTDK